MLFRSLDHGETFVRGALGEAGESRTRDEIDRHARRNDLRCEEKVQSARGCLSSHTHVSVTHCFEPASCWEACLPPPPIHRSASPGSGEGVTLPNLGDSRSRRARRPYVHRIEIEACIGPGQRACRSLRGSSLALRHDRLIFRPMIRRVESHCRWPAGTGRRVAV